MAAPLLALLAAVAITGCVGELGPDGTLEEELSTGSGMAPVIVPPNPEPTQLPVVPVAPSVPASTQPVPTGAGMPAGEGLPAPAPGVGVVPAGPLADAGFPPTPVGTVPASPETGFAFNRGTENFQIVWTEPAELYQGPRLVEWLLGLGFPAMGTLSVTIPFRAADQKVHVAIKTLESPDLRGRVLSAQVNAQVGLGDDETNPGRANLYVKSADGFVSAAGERVSLEHDVWTAVELNADNPALVVGGGVFDPSQVVEIGVEIATGSEGTNFRQAQVLIDSITWR